MGVRAEQLQSRADGPGRGTVRYASLWILVHVWSRLPARPLLWLGGACGMLAYWLMPGLRSRLQGNLGRVVPPAECGPQARRAVRSLAYYYADLARASRHPERTLDELRSAEGVEHLFEALDEGHGVVVISAHLGNPEFIAHSVGTLGLPVLVFTERLQPQRVHDLIHAARATSGVRFEPVGLRAVRAALEQLHCGGIVAVLADRDVSGGGRPTPLFGAPAPLPTGAVELALRSGAPIVPAFILRESPTSHRVVVLPRLALRRELPREMAIEDGMRQVVEALETGIRLDPGQWFGAAQTIWPPGEPDVRTSDGRTMDG